LAHAKARRDEMGGIVRELLEFILKSRYQQSLTDLESLYGALSQKAFKGELDLSRVALPAESPDIAEEEKVGPSTLYTKRTRLFPALYL